MPEASLTDQIDAGRFDDIPGIFLKEIVRFLRGQRPAVSFFTRMAAILFSIASVWHAPQRNPNWGES